MNRPENTPGDFELSDILRKHAPEFIEKHTLCQNQLKAITDIINCRSAALKGHLTLCDHCGHYEQSYNSCRNRHCNKCQYMKQLIWADKLKGKLLPGKYFHLVFTVPASLNRLLYINQFLCYELMFKAAWSALEDLCRNPGFLGARTGAVSILHTWSSTLVYHPHLHFLVPAGGITEDEMEWIKPRGNYLVPVKTLSKIFRARYAEGIKRMIFHGQIELPQGENGEDILQSIYQKEWVVYAKKTGKTSDQVLEYLARYTHRVAIGNNRILTLDKDRVLFRYKDSDSGRYSRTMDLDVQEFIRRFMQHILPNGFYKIRYFGIFSPNCKELLETCRMLMGKEQAWPRLEGLPVYEVIKIITGKDPSVCKYCKKGRMIPVLSNTG